MLNRSWKDKLTWFHWSWKEKLNIFNGLWKNLFNISRTEKTHPFNASGKTKLIRILIDIFRADFIYYWNNLKLAFCNWEHWLGQGHRVWKQTWKKRNDGQCGSAWSIIQELSAWRHLWGRRELPMLQKWIITDGKICTNHVFFWIHMSWIWKVLWPSPHCSLICITLQLTCSTIMRSHWRMNAE